MIGNVWTNSPHYDQLTILQDMAVHGLTSLDSVIYWKQKQIVYDVITLSGH